MSEVRPTHKDEIDLLELIETIWDGKWIITAFAAISILLGGSFILLKNPQYESKLFYTVDTLPPFYEPDKASTDFQKRFYSASIFDEWKQNNSNTSLVFEDFRTTDVIDGFIVSRSEDELLATIRYEERGRSYVLVKSNQLPILNDFFTYANHVSALLSTEYIVHSNDELKIIGSRFENLNIADSDIKNMVLSIKRYTNAAEKGAKVFDIQRPTMPKKVSPIGSLILAMCLVVGGMTGVFFILVRNAISKRKEQLTKA